MASRWSAQGSAGSFQEGCEAWRVEGLQTCTQALWRSAGLEICTQAARAATLDQQARIRHRIIAAARRCPSPTDLHIRASRVRSAAQDCRRSASWATGSARGAGQKTRAAGTRMIAHLVLFRPKPELSTEDRQALVNAFERAVRD